jgi:hypothetical protein
MAERDIGADYLVRGHELSLVGYGARSRSTSIWGGSRAPSPVWWTVRVYPAQDVLQEVGRVTIAGSRLDVQMGMLWHHLDRMVTLEKSRRTPGAEQCKRIRRLAAERLTGEMLEQVVAAVVAAEAARTRRNEIVHQDWLLRGRDAMRPVGELARITLEDLPAYLEEWERESRTSQDWQRVPSRSVDVVPAQTLDELREVERELASVTNLVSALTFRVASSRETGSPPGYIHPG